MSLALSTVPERKSTAPWVAFLLLLAGALFLAQAVSGRQALLFLVGGALGLTLYHAAFGFTSAWRVFIRERRGAGLRAQMVMLALAVLLFFPALAAGTLFGEPVKGLVSPAGTSVIVGAFIFGIGMQLGGGCASGTLFTVGGGNARMLVTLLFFIVGSVVATHHIGWWFALPSLPPTSIVQSLGLFPALVLSLALFAAIAAVSVVLERRRQPQELDSFLWLCPKCGEKLYEESLHVTNLVTQLPPVFEHFYGNPDHCTCKRCGTKVTRGGAPQ